MIKDKEQKLKQLMNSACVEAAILIRLEKYLKKYEQKISVIIHLWIMRGMKKLKIKVLIISLIIAISATGCGGGVSMKDEKVGMEKWLIERYGKEFVVGDVNKYTPYLGATKVIEGIAYPKDNEDIKFTISKYAHGGYTSNGMLYLENYYEILWEYQYKNQIKSIIDSEHIKVAISAPYAIIDKEIKGKTLNLDEVKEIYTDSISARITYLIFSDLCVFRNIRTAIPEASGH
jgi:hypothetical protein